MHIGGRDYETIQEDLDITTSMDTGSNLRVCVNINILNDVSVEPNEVFHLELRRDVSLTQHNIVFNPNLVYINITDNEGEVKPNQL